MDRPLISGVGTFVYQAVWELGRLDGFFTTSPFALVFAPFVVARHLMQTARKGNQFPINPPPKGSGGLRLQGSEPGFAPDLVG